MTKEELEKEATEYAQKLGAKDFIAKPKEIVAYFGYLAGAEPREKRIEELEAEVKEWKDKADLWCNTANLKDHNIMINKELEKENAELRKRVNELEEMYEKSK